jgi:molybdate transport system substrate-binding protein
MTIVAGIIGLVTTILLGCTRPVVNPGEQAQDSLTIFAAASLTEAFREVGDAFEAGHPGSEVTFNFAGSQQLALQIQQGARAGVFASADERQMAKVIAAGLVTGDEATTFARNSMIAIVPGDNPGGVDSLHDLARPGLKLVLAGEQVPAGAYARQVLARLSADATYGPRFGPAVLANVISNEENIRQVVAKIRLGEADAAIVYRSDVTPDVADEVQTIDIPAAFNVTATYPLAVLETAQDPELARQFVAFVLSPEGQRILVRWGLLPAQE